METCWFWFKIGNMDVCLKGTSSQKKIFFSPTSRIDLAISLVFTFLSTRKSCFLHQGPTLNLNKLAVTMSRSVQFNGGQQWRPSLCDDLSLSSAHQTHDIRNVITSVAIHLNLEHFLDHQWTTLNSAKFDSNLCQYTV